MKLGNLSISMTLLWIFLEFAAGRSIRFRELQLGKRQPKNLFSQLDRQQYSSQYYANGYYYTSNNNNNNWNDYHQPGSLVPEYTSSNSEMMPMGSVPATGELGRNQYQYNRYHQYPIVDESQIQPTPSPEKSRDDSGNFFTKLFFRNSNNDNNRNNTIVASSYVQTPKYGYNYHVYVNSNRQTEYRQQWKYHNDGKKSENEMVSSTTPRTDAKPANNSLNFNVPILNSITSGILGEIQNHIHLIKPGTKWCGDGNKARSYQDIGLLYGTDLCCRDHDRCPEYIPSQRSKYGLYNDGHFTRSHCGCDADLYNCLKRVNTPFATGVGITYFNILKMKCFKKEYPVIMCIHSSGWFTKQCTQYVVDMSKEREWQWFDNYEF